MDDLQRLVARDEIRDLAIRYAHALDLRDMDALIQLFVDDVQVGREARGREALRRSFEEQLRAIGISILFVGNHLIEFQDDSHARGRVYCRGEIQEGERWITQAIQYRDQYEQRGGRWYFVRRKHLLWYGAEHDESPLGLPAANWPRSSTGRGTLPEGEESWQRFWRERG